MTHRIDNARCKIATEKACLIAWDDGEEWFPNSQIDDDSEVYSQGDEGTFICSDWIAKQKGLD
jgi:hypothetical protein